MSTNIEMSVLQFNGSYETLYPQTDYNILINKPNIPSLPLSIENGGTGANNYTTARSNLHANYSSYVGTYIEYTGNGANSWKVSIDGITNKSKILTIEVKSTGSFTMGVLSNKIPHLSIVNSTWLGFYEGSGDAFTYNYFHAYTSCSPINGFLSFEKSSYSQYNYFNKSNQDYGISIGFLTIT